MEVLEKRFVPKNTDSSTKWALFTEARRKDGANYPPKTVYLLLTGLLQHMH